LCVYVLFSYCPAHPHIFTLSLHDALPISPGFSILVPHGISEAGLPKNLREAASYLSTHQRRSEYGPERCGLLAACSPSTLVPARSEEHTSELQSREKSRMPSSA